MLGRSVAGLWRCVVAGDTGRGRPTHWCFEALVLSTCHTSLAFHDIGWVLSASLHWQLRVNRQLLRFRRAVPPSLPSSFPLPHGLNSFTFHTHAAALCLGVSSSG